MKTNPLKDEERTFTRDQFRDFMFSQSRPYPEMIELVRDLKSHHEQRIAVVNNEARELNSHRIRTFNRHGSPKKWSRSYVNSHHGIRSTCRKRSS